MYIKGFTEIYGETANLLKENGFAVPPEVHGRGCDSFEIPDELFKRLNLEHIQGSPSRAGRLRVKGKIY